MLFEEISPRGPIELTRLRMLRTELCTLFLAGGMISFVICLAMMR